MGCGWLVMLFGCLQDQAKAAYDFPFPAGKSIRILQGNGVGTHTGNLHHSWDFLIPVGEVVVAAREGTVGKISDHASSRRGMGILIIHDDGTCATYGHLLRGSHMVKKGERVLRGEPIGKVGPESGCPTPHLHFHVTDSPRTMNTIAVRFQGPRGPCNPTAGDICASTTAEPADLAQIRLLRRTLPLLILAMRIRARDLEQEMRKAIAPALKNARLAEWAKPYQNLGSPAPLQVPEEVRPALIEALRHDLKGEWGLARPLYEKAQHVEEVKPLHAAITEVVR
jgi:murein DD-endopeptidase MepM/ murein hydrolase activator NlpD